MNDLMIALYIFLLASFAGFELISRVPPLLHTPLMSGSNAVSGIIVVGALVAAGSGLDAGRRPAGLRRGGPGHDQRRGRLRGDGPHAGHVQGPEKPAPGGGRP